MITQMMFAQKAPIVDSPLALIYALFTDSIEKTGIQVDKYSTSSSKGLEYGTTKGLI
jgi:hypothetical protein